MKVNKFHIFKFRSIEHLELEMNNDHLITIVGQNESGKTSVLQAIAWWGGDPNIAVTNDDILGEEPAIINSKDPIVEVEVVLTSEEVETLSGNRSRIINVPPAIDPETGAEIPSVKMSIQRFFDGSYKAHRISENDIETINFNEAGFKEVFPRFIYYDVFEEYIDEDAIPWGEVLTKPGWKNVAAILGIDQAKHQEITQLLKIPNVFKLDQYEEEFTGDLTNKFHVFWEGTPKQLRVSLKSNRLAVICIDLDEDGRIVRRLKPSQMSTGFRWAFCLNTKLEALSREDPTRPLFLLLDEPNTSLSGDQQKKVLETFERFCVEENSIILATHSPFMVDLKHQIMLLEAKDGISTFQCLDELHGTDLLITLRAALNLKLVDSLFFGRYLLIVEGLTDRGHLQLVVKEWLEKNNISILEADGASQLPVKLKELEKEGLIKDIIVVLDSDQAGIAAKMQVEKQLREKGVYLPIRMIRGKDIEDYYSRADFQKICVGFLKGDEVQMLEDTLSSLSKKEIERGRLKKVINTLRYKTGVFKLLFLAYAREIGVEQLSQDTKENFKQLTKSLNIGN